DDAGGGLVGADVLHAGVAAQADVAGQVHVEVGLEVEGLDLLLGDRVLLQVVVGLAQVHVVVARQQVARVEAQHPAHAGEAQVGGVAQQRGIDQRRRASGQVGEVDLGALFLGALAVVDADVIAAQEVGGFDQAVDGKSTRLNSSHVKISYAVFCLKKKRRH